MEKKDSVSESTTPDIAAIVQAAVTAALEATGANQSTFATTLGESIAAGIKANSGVRKIGVGERQKKGLGQTPFNPTNRKRSLKWDFYHNGALMHERYLHDNEIEMLHQLTPGQYLNKMVRVVERDTGDGRKRTFIVHPEDKDAALRLKGLAPNFHALLVKLVAEAKEQKAARRAAMRAELAEE